MSVRARGLLFAFTLSIAAWVGLAAIGMRVYNSHTGVDPQMTSSIAR